MYVIVQIMKIWMNTTGKYQIINDVLGVLNIDEGASEVLTYDYKYMRETILEI